MKKTIHEISAEDAVKAAQDATDELSSEELDKINGGVSFARRNKFYKKIIGESEN